MKTTKHALLRAKDRIDSKITERELLVMAAKAFATGIDIHVKFKTTRARKKYKGLIWVFDRYPKVILITVKGGNYEKNSNKPKSPIK